MTFPIKTSDGFDARPVVLVNPATGEPYTASGGGGGGGGSSDTTEATQLQVLAELQNLDTDVGALTDAPAPADGTGDFSIVSAFKRALLNGASMLARIPFLSNGRMPVETANIGNKFREAFEVYDPVNGGRWTQVLANGDIIMLGGNTAASSYLLISKDPRNIGESRIQTIPTWDMPFEMAVALSRSQATLGQEFSIEVVSDEAPLTAPADLQIASISQTGTVLTVNTVNPHNLRPGIRMGVRDCVDSRMNYSTIVVATTPSDNQFTVTAGPFGNLPSVTAGPFNSGFVYQRSAMGLAPNGTSMILENAGNNQASFYVRSESGDYLPSSTINANHSVTIGTTGSVQAVNAARAYAFQATTQYRLTQMVDGVQWTDNTVDGLGSWNNRLKRDQVIPDISANYRFRIRATNNPSLTRPIAKIVSAVKTGTTTATVTTDIPHGLTTADFIQTYGVRDQTNFPNLATATAVASASGNQFTVVWGGAVTATTFGGVVARVNGGQLLQGLVINGNVQTISRDAAGIVSVGTLTAVSGLLFGDTVQLDGVRNAVDGGDVGLDGAYMVRDIQTTTVFLEPIGTTPTGGVVASVNCGGVILRRTDLRVSHVRAMDFERQRVELLARPSGDLSASAPANIQNVPAVSQSGTWNVGQILGTAATRWFTQLTDGTNSPAIKAASTAAVVADGSLVAAISPNSLAPIQVVDVASAALTTTTTTAAIIPTGGTSYQVNIPVTAVTGTNPTLDTVVQESDDGGTNWFDVYHFERITGVGMFRSPKLPFNGNRVRYVQTVTGTTPSFTRAVNRNQCYDSVGLYRRLLDRAIAPNTLNSASAIINIEGATSISLLVSSGAGATTNPVYGVQLSVDGTVWADSGISLTVPPSSNLFAVLNGVNGKFARIYIRTAGVAATQTYASLQAAR